MPSWTSDQSLAINTRGGKIIVSAAAGSGKTAVLSERVLRLIMDGTSASSLLIVTFTKAAAEEMKIRIKDKIKEAYEKDPENTYLKKQISLIDSAYITTMDAFYNTLVRDNFEKLDIDKDFDILPNEEEKIIKSKVITNVLENMFDNNINYEDLLSFFGASSVSLIKDVVFKVSDFLDTIPFYEVFINKALENYKNDFYKESMLKNIRDKMKAYNALYEEIIDALYNESDDFDKVLELARKERNYINDFLTITSFDELSRRLRTIEFDTLRTPRGHKDDAVMVKYKVIRDEFKNEIKKNLKEFYYITDNSYYKEQEKTFDALNILFDVVKTYKEELFSYKNKINKYTFSDVAHLCLNLLIKDGKRTELSKRLSNNFSEILIDEYQDTNNLQNVIFNAISKDNKNLFIVGDVKQSIYRFRSACPEIFNGDKSSASKDDFPRLITLSKNFRSRKEVLDFCNFIFENTMTNYFGEVNYDKDEKLYLGASYDEGKNLDSEVIIIDGKEKNDNEEDDLNKTQKEAIVVAEKIKKLIYDKHQVYDNKKGIWRDIKPSDIVILLRSLKNSNVFKEALNKRNISVYMESSSEYFDNYEVKLVINLLKVIDNPYDDVALLSVLTSPVMDVSYDLVAEARKDKYTSLYENLINFNNPLINKYLDDIKRYRNLSLTVKISSLLTTIYKEFNVIPILSAFKGGIKREKNLEQMIKHANDFEAKKNVSLYSFISYLENVILNKGSLEGVNPLSEGDNVLITTIHKSKGLEYPVVFLSETGKKFNFEDLRKNVMINEDLGFATNLKDNDYKLKYESVPIMLFKENEKSKMLSEELRILYVALTRAKEKIIITGYTNDIEQSSTKISSMMGDKEVISNFYLSSVKCYLDIIIACLLRHKDGKELRSMSMFIPKVYASESNINLKVVSASTIDESEFKEKTKEEKNSFDMDMFNKIIVFNYDGLCNVPKYLSVSDIKHKTGYLRNPNFLSDSVSHTNLGTVYHKIFELLPTKKYGIKELENELKNLVDNGFIMKEDYKLINLDKIFAYLTSDLYDELLSADKVYKEMKIDFEIPANYYDKALKSGMILVSGIVDLMYVKDDLYTIVDYKTDNVDELSELSDLYKVQLDLYEMAIKSKMKAEKVKKYIYSVKLNKYIEV